MVFFYSNFVPKKKRGKDSANYWVLDFCGKFEYFKNVFFSVYDVEKYIFD